MVTLNIWSDFFCINRQCGAIFKPRVVLATTRHLLILHLSCCHVIVTYFNFKRSCAMVAVAYTAAYAVAYAVAYVVV